MIYLLTLFIVFSVLQARGDDLEHDSLVENWKIIEVPATANASVYDDWAYAANKSRYEWRVWVSRSKIHARQDTAKDYDFSKKTNFAPEADSLRIVSAVAAVEDGFLIGFSERDAGGLYWFSSDGKNNYKVSDHRIVAIESIGNAFYALEGRHYFLTSEGSVLKISKSPDDKRWKSDRWVALDYAPETMTLSKDKTMYIVTSKSLVSVNRNCEVTTLFRDAPWYALYPNSSILSPDEKVLYIGMRQYVCVVDLATNKLQMRVPDEAFLSRSSPAPSKTCNFVVPPIASLPPGPLPPPLRIGERPSISEAMKR